MNFLEYYLKEESIPESVQTKNITAYHGSNSEDPLNVYCQNSMDCDAADLGMFFSSDESTADAYGKVGEYKLSFNNPYIVYADDLVDAGYFDISQNPNSPEYKGHDGIIVLSYGLKRDTGLDWYDDSKNTSELVKKFGRYTGEQMDYWGANAYIVFRKYLKDVVRRA